MTNDNTQIADLGWDGFLCAARLWPAQAIEWDTVASFTDQIQKLAAQKLHERAASNILQQTINSLIQEFTNEEFALFGAQECASWNAEGCPVEQTSTVASRVETLKEKMLSYRALDNHHSANPIERRKLRQEIAEVEGEITELYNTLANLFGSFKKHEVDDAPKREPFYEPPSPGIVLVESVSETTPDITPLVSGSIANALPVLTNQIIETNPEDDTSSSLTSLIARKPHSSPISLSQAFNSASLSLPNTDLDIPAELPKPVLQSSIRSDNSPWSLIRRPLIKNSSSAAATSTTTSEPPETTELDSQYNAHEVTSGTEVDVASSPEAVSEPTTEIPPDTDSEPITLEQEKAQSKTDIGQEVLAEDGVTLNSVATSEVSTNIILEQPIVTPSQQTGTETQIHVAEDSPDRKALLWDLIENDDVSGAYWLAWSLEEARFSTPVPSSLLAAVQGARWLQGDEDTLSRGLLNALEATLVEESDDNASPEFGLLRLAAALYPSLIAPTSGMQAWLSVPEIDREPIRPLVPLVTTIRAFAERNIPLRPEDLNEVSNRDERDREFTRVAEDARALLSRTLVGRTQHRRASDVLVHLLKHELTPLLEPVQYDRRDEAKAIKETASRWQSPAYITARIREIDRDKLNMKVADITGSPRDKIIREVEQACEIALRWCALVEREAQLSNRGDWVSQQVAQLREGVRVALPDVLTVLSEFEDSTHPPELRAACICLRHSLDLLRRELLSASAAFVEHWPRPARARTLQGALAYRLLRLPEVELNVDESDSITPRSISLHAIAPALEHEEEHRRIGKNRTLREMCESRLSHRDYRFWPEYEEMAASESMAANERATFVSDFRRLYAEGLEGSRLALRDMLYEADTAITQAVVDGIIGEERPEYKARLVSINPDAIWEFVPEFKKLEELHADLQVERNRRRQAQQQQWQTLQERVEFGRLPLDMREQVARVLFVRLEQADARVVDELLSELESVLDGGGALSSNWDEDTEPKDERDPLEEFQQKFRRLEEWLLQRQQRGGTLSGIINDVEEKRAKAGFAFNHLSDKRIAEATRALEAWQRLKESSPRSPEDKTLHAIAIVLGQFLGFNLDGTASESLQVVTRGRDYLHLEAQMSASNFSPVPQFGSDARGRYALLCVWERPSPDTIDAYLSDLRLRSRSVLVLYLGRLGERQRRDFAEVCRDDKLALAVLDEMLLLFLCGERDARLPIFFRCTLPLSAINPYTPFEAGNVPPEMFFGRAEMARELAERSGSCLVYGGRQLGKSALLRHVARLSHSPQTKEFAWVEDIKNIGDPLGVPDTNTLWRRMRDRCKEHKILHANISTDDPEQILLHIRNAVMNDPQVRILMLFDEADHFLDADAKNNFRVVSDLRRLMSDTERRVKVIFAGLHNVYRFQKIPNQPLAHFGTPICVGPLDAHDAKELVRQPLGALGYKFGNGYSTAASLEDKNSTNGEPLRDRASSILRILSYTNYHPGLIQLFCQELLNKLHERSVESGPPYYIGQKDVEDAYRTVRKSIQERFEWTLALDKRYQAIAWTLIDESLSHRENTVRPYRVREIADMVRGVWPRGFLNAKDEEVFGLLEEMCGLGVLSHGGEGGYRLRSPNLMRLVGSQEEVLSHLIALSDQEPEQGFVPESHHMLLDEESHLYSPLTHAQVEGLAPKKWGVGLIFASDALGLQILPDAFRDFIPADTPENLLRWAKIPSNHTNASQIKKWLDDFCDKNIDRQAMVVWQLVSGDTENLVERLQAALTVCRKRMARGRWLRVLFLLDPLATWRYLSLPLSTRRELEESIGVGSVTAPRPWNALGIAQRLKQQQLLDTEKVCQGILDATGGWPLLLDEVFRKVKKGTDPRDASKTVTQMLMPDSTLSKKFRASLGFENERAALRILNFIHMQGTNGVIDTELVVPDFVSPNDGQQMTLEECERAVDYLQLLSCLYVQEDKMLLDPIVARVLSPSL